jgi:DNA-binding CsgD family transcriptional regulator
VAGKRPLLVAGDDAHWLDRPSAEVLAFVSRRIATEPITVVLSLRDGDGDPFQAAGLPSLSLGPLAAGASRALLGRVAPHLAAADRERLLARAAGNPLALHELPSGPGPGPLAVSDLLRRSFTAGLPDLTSRARMLLSVAATGAGAGLAELCQVAAAASGEPVSVIDIQPAIDARLVRLEADRVVFVHPLTAAAICQSLTVADRQHIQHALAQLSPRGDGHRRSARQLLDPIGSPELTPQELQIAQLAADGLSNRQIAQQLSVSHRTVGSHLYHLFPKLGITTRVQLAHALGSSIPGRLASSSPPG